MPDPIHQFEIHRIIPLKLFGYDVSFTNSALFMLIAVVLSAGMLIYAMRDGSLVPRRLQSTAEVGYEFIANMVRDAAGEQGMKFFPLIFTIFAFNSLAVPKYSSRQLKLGPMPSTSFCAT